MCLALLKMTLGHDETAILKQKPGVLQTFGSFFIKNTAKIGRGSWSVCPLASTYLSMPLTQGETAFCVVEGTQLSLCHFGARPSLVPGGACGCGGGACSFEG